MTPAEESADMLQLLRSDRQWTQGDFRNGTRSCLLGAYARVTGHSDSWWGKEEAHADERPYLRILKDVIREQFPERVADCDNDVVDIIIDFNDMESTHFIDIRQVLEKTHMHAQEMI